MTELDEKQEVELREGRPVVTTRVWYCTTCGRFASKRGELHPRCVKTAVHGTVDDLRGLQWAEVRPTHIRVDGIWLEVGNHGKQGE